MGFAVAVFLIAPILVVFPMSLGSSPFLTPFPPTDLVQMVRRLLREFRNGSARSSLSLEVAAVTVAGAVVLGTAAAILRPDRPALAAGARDRLRPADDRSGDHPRRRPLLSLRPRRPRRLVWGWRSGHTVLAAYVFITVRAALKTFDPNLELAAIGLGAPWGTMARRILVPVILPAFSPAQFSPSSPPSTT